MGDSSSVRARLRPARFEFEFDLTQFSLPKQYRFDQNDIVLCKKLKKKKSNKPTRVDSAQVQLYDWVLFYL